jgi:hypothetical protein
MPGRVGDKLAQEFLRICPGISIILCTWFSEYITEEKAMEGSGVCDEAAGDSGFSRIYGESVRLPLNCSFLPFQLGEDRLFLKPNNSAHTSSSSSPFFPVGIPNFFTFS